MSSEIQAFTPRRWAILLPFVAGTIAVASIFQFALMATNVAGHFPRLVQDVHAAAWLLDWHFLLYIVVYYLGAVFAAFFYHRPMGRLGYAMPFLSTWGILTLTFFGVLTDKTALTGLFFVMSAQNTFSSLLTSGAVKPSQMTGIVIDLGVNSVAHSLGQPAAKSRLVTLLLVLVSFILGIFANFGLIHYGHVSPFGAPVVLQTVAVLALIFSKKTDN